MHKYIVLFFSATLILSSCKHNSADNPVIERAQMISLLTDIHIVDGGIYNMVTLQPDSMYKYGTARYLVIFKKHHVDSSAFRRSLKYYSGRPGELEAMYDEILKRLADKTDSTNKQMLKINNGRRPAL